MNIGIGVSIGKQSVKMGKSGMTNFVGKIANNVVSNPNKSFRLGGSTTLSPPSSFTTELDDGRYSITSILDGVTTSQSGSVNGQIAQMLFSFNLIEYVKRKYGFTPTVQWLKDNTFSLLCNWHGKGSSATNNKSYLKRYNVVNNTWDGASEHSNSSITRLQQGLGSGLTSALIDVNGMCHFLAHADSSNGSIASTIETDYVELIIEMKNTLVEVS